MKKINLRRITLPVFWGIGVAFSFATSAVAQAPENLKIAALLVEKAQLQKMAALGMRLSVRRAVAEGKASQLFLECVSAEDPSVFSRQIASVYAEGLSASEMMDALSFFDSAAGQKYVAYTFHGTEKYAGFTPSTPPTTVTIDEKKSIEAFVSSNVGKQMTGARSALAISSQREIAKVVEPILARCRN